MRRRGTDHLDQSLLTRVSIWRRKSEKEEEGDGSSGSVTVDKNLEKISEEEEEEKKDGGSSGWSADDSIFDSCCSTEFSKEEETRRYRTEYRCWVLGGGRH